MLNPLIVMLKSIIARCLSLKESFLVQFSACILLYLNKYGNTSHEKINYVTLNDLKHFIFFKRF